MNKRYVEIFIPNPKGGEMQSLAEEIRNKFQLLPVKAGEKKLVYPLEGLPWVNIFYDLAKKHKGKIRIYYEKIKEDISYDIGELVI